MPEVTSAVIRLDFSLAPPAIPRPFGPLVRGIFTMRRKVLANALAPVAAGLGRDGSAALAAADLDGRRRPETLAVAELLRLAEALDRAPTAAG
jgi:16S rRNA A1518/A1519 N6-dimethyltransferase RsmA/KsgA/DIM1 with predicted DNA glycosylase/AP lyase activity